MGTNHTPTSDFLLTGSYQNERDVSRWTSEIKKYLTSNGVNINARNYKQEENYKGIKNVWFSGFPGGAMSLEEFIDRFMPTKYTFESKYDMGNSCEMEESDYADRAIIAEISEKFIDEKGTITDEIRIAIKQKSGLIDRIKKYLGIDLNKTDKNDDREKRERSKIIYFFYMLEHRYHPGTKVLMLLDKPSMESVDNTLLGWQTYHGETIRFVKESLGKELSLEKKDHIYSTLANISMAWDAILDNARFLLDFLYDYGFDYNLVELFPSSIPDFTGNTSNQDDICQYPIERLYLTISQREYLGNLLGITFVNKIQNSNNYDIPPELVEEMKSLIHKPVDFNKAGNYIYYNAQILSRYVYLGKKASKEDVRRIRTFAHKIEKFFPFCYRANNLLDIREISNELQIVSFLQAVILDDQSEAFDYTYHAYQKKSKHMMRVQAALKTDNHVPDALQVYWVRKVADRWYANVGKYGVRLKLRQVEETCDEIRKRILSQPTLEGMMAAHKFYMEQVDPSLLEVRNQIWAVRHVVDFLHDLGFTYKDDECKIRFAFLSSEYCNGICGSILSLIQDTIQDRDPSCQINLEPSGKAVKDAGCSLEFAFDYLEKTCTLVQFELIMG